MKLIDHLRTMSRDARDEFAMRCGTTRGHMTNIAYGYRPCAPGLAVSIERESCGLVSRQEMRPADWHRIWPELVAA